MERDSSHNRSRKLARVLALALLATLVAPPGFVHAQDPEEEVSEATEYKRLLAKAQELYSDEDYAGAAAAYEAAYEIKPKPNLLYNVARIYEKMGEFDKAIDFYGRFAKEPGVELAARQDAIERRKTLAEVVALDKPDPEPDPKPEDVVDPVEPDPDEIVKADPDPDPVGETNYVPAIVTLSAGVLALGGGGVMGVLATNEDEAASSATTLDGFRGSRQTADTYALAADGLFVLGGALTITGVILLLTASPEDANTQALIAPVIGPDGVGVTTSLRF